MMASLVDSEESSILNQNHYFERVASVPSLQQPIYSQASIKFPEKCALTTNGYDRSL